MKAAGPGEDNRLQQELEALFRENKQLIYRVARRVTGNTQDAEDILQDLFVKLARGQRSSDFKRNPKGYLHRAAINSAVSLLRSRESERLADGDMDSMEIPAPEDGSWRKDDIDRVRRAMAKMKPNLIEIVNLYYSEGYSCREIAEITGRLLPTVVADLFRARAQLKRLMGIQEKYRETRQRQDQRVRKPDLADISRA
jgi:RNA polymerase sigma-70 factor (ECF subfamily)